MEINQVACDICGRKFDIKDDFTENPEITRVRKDGMWMATANLIEKRIEDVCKGCLQSTTEAMADKVKELIASAEEIGH